MEKKQYDEIVDLLCNAERDDLVSALSATTGFELCQQIEQLRDDLAATYKTITQLRGQLADAQQRVKDFEDDYKLVMDEKCGKDDKLHCTCVPSLRAAIKDARSEMFDLFHQACCVEYVKDGDSKYDNQCMSCYEYAEDKLIEWELLKPEQCLRRKREDEKEK